MPGSLPHSPADITAQAIVDMALGTDPATLSTWPVSVSSEPPLPDNCITTFGTVGKKHGRDTDGEIQEHHGIQVRVRSQTPKVGYAKIKAICDGLDTLYMRTVHLESSTYLIWACSRQGDIIELGKEMPESRRNIFTVDYLVSVRSR